MQVMEYRQFIYQNIVNLIVINMAKKVETVEAPLPPKKTVLLPLTLDYPHEYLNDMGRKINQIIEHLNA